MSAGLTASKRLQELRDPAECAGWVTRRERHLDGEIVALDSNGVSQFKELLYRKGRAVFFAFDLVWLDGVDLRQTPLIERKKKLRKLERSKCPEILYAQHVERDGKLLFEEVV